MNTIKNYVSISWEYIITFLKWIVVSCIIGAVGGVIGSVFHLCVDYVTEFRLHHGIIILLLPVGGLAIAGMYHLFARKGALDTNRVLEAVRQKESVPFVMIPLIFISTVITHALGGSAGREGAALQLGGGIGYNTGKLLRMNKRNTHILVMSGMSSVFAALFGTPITAAVFALEVTSVGIFHYAALLPCIISSIAAFAISQAFGIAPVRFPGLNIAAFSPGCIGKVILLAAMCAWVAILFCAAIQKCEHISAKWLKNRYLRAAVGGAVLVLITCLVGNQDYNGAGMEVIEAALAGNAKPEAFLLKIVFTAITIAVGFRGGEIVPSFFIGATFGCVFGKILELDPGFGAAIGFVALFCSVVNCPLASLMLAIEVFGTNGILFFAIVCAVSYALSGNFGLYHSQELVFSKLHDEEVHQHTNESHKNLSCGQNDSRR